jgi:RsiW-degrading membrane proteinase PrsW (M82 family)
VLTADNVIFFSALAAIIPVLLYVGLIYWIDRYEKEPWWLLSAAFLWGAVPGALLALLFNTLLSVPLYVVFSEGAADRATGTAIAPVVEETAKAIILLFIFFLRRRELDSPLDGIIYGAMVGMGFALMENVLYYVAAYQEAGVVGWRAVVGIRGLIFGLNHALYTSMTGLGIAIAANSRSPWVRLGAPLAGWAAAVALHSFHNLAMSGGGPAAFVVGVLFDWAGVLLTVVIIALALYQERRWMRRYLVDEVALGTLSAEEYQLVSSAARRNRYRLRLLLREGVHAYRRCGRRFHHCSELAYLNRRYAHFGDDGSRAAADQLRQTMRQLETGQ